MAESMPARNCPHAIASSIGNCWGILAATGLKLVAVPGRSGAIGYSIDRNFGSDAGWEPIRSAVSTRPQAENRAKPLVTTPDECARLSKEVRRPPRSTFGHEYERRNERLD